MTDLDVSSYVKDGELRIFAKPAKRKTSILGFDTDRNALVVEIGAQAVDNKANLELIKFFSKLLKKKVRMKSGMTGKEKVLLIE